MEDQKVMYSGVGGIIYDYFLDMSMHSNNKLQFLMGFSLILRYVFPLHITVSYKAFLT